jgi:type IV pilus modification protein PilV
MMVLIKDNNGFTLVEIMIAMVVLSIGLLGIASMQIKAVQGNALSMGLTEAATLGQNQIENLMSMGYNSNFLNDVDGDGNNGAGLGDPGADNIWDHPNKSTPDDNDTGVNADYSFVQGRYRIDWNVSVGFPITNTKTIRVLISWLERNDVKYLSMDYIIFDQI